MRVRRGRNDGIVFLFALIFYTYIQEVVVCSSSDIPKQ